MKRRIKRTLHFASSTIRSIRKTKIFCIGSNKTGTLSLGKALGDLGIIVALQRPAEMLLDDWKRRDFRRIVRFCYTAQAFRDIPFSLPFTFQILDMKFPGSKFILTIRDNPEQWYSSVTRYHTHLFGSGNIPDHDELKKAEYCRPGWMLNALRSIFPTPADDIYNKEILINHYNFHNQSVIEYFRHRADDLLVLNVSERGAYKKLCEFLKKPCLKEEFPWENKTP